jgi:hypothetical protein
MDLGQTIVVYLGIFLILWYAVALIYNRRLGIRTYRWLQPGVATLGKITQAKWLGSSGSGARIGVAQAKHPFRQAEVAFLLETRELLPLWLLNRLRGIRDSLVVRAQLRSVPQGELESCLRALPIWRSADRVQAEPVGHAGSGAPGRTAGRARAQHGQIAGAAKALLNEVGPGIRRLLAAHRPHLILDVKSPS